MYTLPVGEAALEGLQWVAIALKDEKFGRPETAGNA
jgi:hypothetical protein